MIAPSTAPLSARIELDFDNRRLLHPEHGIVVEIALLHGSILDGDLPFQRSAQAEDDRAFHLSSRAIGIHHRTAVDRGNHSMNANVAILFQRNLGDLGHVGLE